VSNWCNVNRLLLADWCCHWLRRRSVATSFILI